MVEVGVVGVIVVVVVVVAGSSRSRGICVIIYSEVLYSDLRYDSTV